MSTQGFSTAYHCSNRILKDLPSGMTFLQVLVSVPRVGNDPSMMTAGNVAA